MQRASVHVSRRAIRRYAELALGRTESLAAGDDDRLAIHLLSRGGVDTTLIRARLQEASKDYRVGGSGILADGVRLRVSGCVMTDVVDRRRSNRLAA